MKCGFDNTFSRLRPPPRGEETHDIQSAQFTPSLGGGVGERVLLTSIKDLIMKILLINGANLNMLGSREPEKYGSTTLKDIESGGIQRGNELGVQVDVWQSNHEGDIVDKIQSAKGVYDGILINAGGYTHTSVVIRDAIASVQIPTVEIHMTNIHAREEFRHTSLLSGVCIAQVVGFKELSYTLALEGLVNYLKNS